MTAGIEDDVVFRVDFGQLGVGFVIASLSVQVIGHGDPRADVIPVEGGFDVENA